MVNDRALDAYCPQAEFAFLALRPLRKVGLTESVDLQIRVNGGGLMGQAGAISLGIARALLAMQPEVRAIIKPDGLFTRDPRMRERKKSGRPGARKRFQFSKR
jgi:small subunit ribosomal protein S9